MFAFVSPAQGYPYSGLVSPYAPPDGIEKGAVRQGSDQPVSDRLPRSIVSASGILEMALVAWLCWWRLQSNQCDPVYAQVADDFGKESCSSHTAIDQGAASLPEEQPGLPGQLRSALS